MIFELLAFRASDGPELKACARNEQLCAMTWEALQQMEAGDFTAAAGGYRAILDKFPGDPLAKFALKECEGRAANVLKKVGQ